MGLVESVLFQIVKDKGNECIFIWGIIFLESKKEGGREKCIDENSFLFQVLDGIIGLEYLKLEII